MKCIWLTFVLTIVCLLGYAQPVLVKENAFSYPADLTDVNGTLLFSDYNVLWKSNGSDASTTIVKDFGPYADNFIRFLKNVNGTLYFTVFDGIVNEASLWKSNGTPETTIKVKGFPNASDYITDFTNIQNTVYFTFKDGLYKTDGTPQSTVLVKDFTPGGDSGFILLFAFNNNIYATVDKRTVPESGPVELWKSNGTEAGTSQLKTFIDCRIIGSAASNLYMVANDGVTGKELWKTDVSGNTSIVKDITPGSANTFLNTFTSQVSFNNQFLFTTANSIWKTDGTSAGTVLIKSYGFMEGITKSTSTVFFRSNEGLGKTDGTTAGTSTIKTIPQNVGINNFTPIGNQLFFSLDYDEIWQSDGTANGTVFIKNVIPNLPNAYSDELNMGVSGGNLYYTSKIKFYTDPEFEGQYTTLWKYNPTQIWIPSFTIINSNTEKDIRRLKQNDTLYTDEKITFRADATPGTKSVKFYINDVLKRTESERPFAIAGDLNGDYNEWIKSKGNYKLTATPTSTTGATGTTTTINFVVVDRNTPPPPVTISLILVNAKTDQDVRELKNNDTIPYNPQTDEITIRAVPKTSVGSIAFYLDGSIYRTETTSPYALKGDANNDYNPWPATLGKHTLKVTAYSGANGSGSILSERTISFLLTNTSTNNPAQITFTLVNAVTDQDIGPLVNNQIIDLAQTGNKLNIRANSTLQGTKSIVFDFNNTTKYKVESAAPYSIFGDNNGNYNVWTATAGTYILKATPYTNTGGTGTAGAPLSITFYVTGTASARIAAYPNPMEETITLSLVEDNNSNGLTEIIIFDDKGMEYYKQTSDISLLRYGMNISLQNLNMTPGIYFVKIIQEGEEVQVLKLIKN